MVEYRLTFAFPDGVPAVVHVHIDHVDTPKVLDAIRQLSDDPPAKTPPDPRI